MRTGGERRLSNFVPWQARGAGAEIYFCEAYWPRFEHHEFLKAVSSYTGDDEDERAEMEAELREEYREDIDVHRMASEVVIDEIVPPSSLREELAARFAFYETVDKDLPDKKHGTVL